MTVGFQGEAGAFSEEAAHALLGAMTARGYTTFDELIGAVDRQEVTYGLLPVENTIYGSIARSYDLLAEFPNVRVVDEVAHRISQCLIGYPGTTLDDIAAVASHPVALEQCRAFFAAHPSLERRTVHDTAGAVRELMELAGRSVAAIASAGSAQTYGAAVLLRDIQDDAANFTRFLLVARGTLARRNLNRALLTLELPHEVGSLHDALSVLAEARCNLRSLVPRPDRKTPFAYRFHLELDYRDRSAFDLAVERLQESLIGLHAY
ncbi:MAG: prephenate dehydratase [Vulcanimicrobiaceae bacterium]